MPGMIRAIVIDPRLRVLLIVVSWLGGGGQALAEDVASRGRSLSFADWIRTQLPGWMTRIDFLIENWQWLGLGLIAFLGVVADRALIQLAKWSFRRWFLKYRDEVQDKQLWKELRPIGLVAMAAVWWIGLQMLDLPRGAESVLETAVKFITLLSGVWAAMRLVDLFIDLFARRAKQTDSKLDDLLLPLIRTSLKVFIAAFGLLFIASNLGTNISSLLAGLGLGGLAFALAAQDTVKNLFGTMTTLLDRTFNVGDWVLIDDVEGTVEHVGFRSTRLRTFYDSVITIPNARLLTVTVDNMGHRRCRRWSTRIGLEYDTPIDKIEAFCEGVRELIRKHPYTRKDYYHVYVNSLAASSIEVLLYVFHHAPDWSTELRERHRLILDTLRLAQNLGVSIAFPTQTIQVKQEEDSLALSPGSLSPSQIQDALRQGQKEAQSIISGTLGSPPRKPGPVQIDRPMEDQG